MEYGLAERNLRDMFRTLAMHRVNGQVCELPGLTIASVGTEFQMFNTAFFNSPVVDRADLEQRVTLASLTFRRRKLPWSLWVCEELIPPEVRPRLFRICERARLYHGTEMPAMAAERIISRGWGESELTIEAVEGASVLQEFCRIGADCFHVPPNWFGEIYNRAERLQGAMRGWVGYVKGQAMATAVTVISEDVIGIYNLATAPEFRKRGFGEAMSRHAIAETLAVTGAKPVVLQSTSQGRRLYERLGFREVGRILVFPSR